MATAEGLASDVSRIWARAFTPDNRHLIAVGQGLRLWDLSSTNTSGGLIMHARLSTNRFEDIVDYTRDLQIHPSGEWCAFFAARPLMAGWQRRVGVQRLGAPTRATFLPLPVGLATVQCAGIVPGREEVAYIADGRSTRLLQFVDIATGKVVREMPLVMPGEHENTFICNFRFSPHRQRLAAAAADGRRIILSILPAAAASIPSRATMRSSGGWPGIQTAKPSPLPVKTATSLSGISPRSKQHSPKWALA